MDPAALLGLVQTARLEVDGAKQDLATAKANLAAAIDRASELGVDVDPSDPEASVVAVKSAADAATQTANDLAVTAEGLAREARAKLAAVAQ